MPYAERSDGTRLHYDAEGAGETVAFVSDLGYGAWLWAWQHAAVAGPFESLVWDLRGTGRSDAPAGPYDLPTLAADLEAVLAAAGADRAHVVGHGLGGLVALQYALDHGRGRSLTLVGTAAGDRHHPADPVDRLFAPRDDEAALRATLDPILSEAFRREQPEVVDGIVEWRADDDADEAGWRAQAAALAGADLAGRLHDVTDPALVVHGGADAVWPPGGGEALAEGLPRGDHAPVPGAGHLVGVEQSRTVNDHLVGFLEAHAEAE